MPADGGGRQRIGGMRGIFLEDIVKADESRGTRLVFVLTSKVVDIAKYVTEWSRRSKMPTIKVEWINQHNDSQTIHQRQIPLSLTILSRRQFHLLRGKQPLKKN